MTCCRTAPAAARTAPTPARARETVARRSYHIGRFMRRPPSIDDEGPTERFAEDRRSERGRIATVDDAQRGPVSGDDASRDRVEHDAGAGGLVALPREVDEVPEAHTFEQPRFRVLPWVGRIHAGDGGRVHDARGVDEP